MTSGMNIIRSRIVWLLAIVLNTHGGHPWSTGAQEITIP